MGERPGPEDGIAPGNPSIASASQTLTEQIVTLTGHAGLVFPSRFEGGYTSRRMAGNVTSNVTSNVSKLWSHLRGGALTIKDVAEYCGVSVSTVSRVLNDHPDVSDSVRKKVQDAIKKLNFVPNKSARDLVAPQSDSIGLVVRGAENPFFTPIIRAIEHSVELMGYSFVVAQIKSGTDEIASAAELVRSKRLKGVVLLGGRYDYTDTEGSTIGAPFVCCTFANSFGSLDPSTFSSVSIDDEAEAYKATKMLIDQGHRKIAMLLDSSSDRSISELRYKGYREALADAGIPLDEGLVLETVDYEMEVAYKRTSELLSSGKDFTALFAVSDAMAIAAMKALHDAGRKVPDECSVIAIDGIMMSLYTVPTLTTLVQPKEEMGEKAVKLLVNMIEGKGQSRQVRMETTLRPGGTVGRLER